MRALSPGLGALTLVVVLMSGCGGRADRSASAPPAEPAPTSPFQSPPPDRGDAPTVPPAANRDKLLGASPVIPPWRLGHTDRKG